MLTKDEIDIELKDYTKRCDEFSMTHDSFDEIEKFQETEFEKLSTEAKEAINKASESFSKKVASQIG